MSKTIKILLIILLLIIIISLIGVMILFITNGFGDANLKLVDSYEAEVGEVDKFDFDLKSTNIEIKPSSNDKILVEYYSSKDTDVKIRNNDKKIIINENESDNNFRNFFFNFNNKRKVIIYVPETYAGEYELNVKSGNIKSEIDLSNNNVNINAKSGNVELDVASSIDISVTSGNIKINEVNKKINIDAKSGNITIDKLCIEENSSITAKSGNVAIKDNQCNCYIETDVKSGDVKVNKSDRKSDTVLKIKTSSGNIRVD